MHFENIEMNKIARTPNIQKTTLVKCTLKINQLEKTNCLFPDSPLGTASETKLANYIKKFQAIGFQLTREVRVTACNLAVQRKFLMKTLENGW